MSEERERIDNDTVQTQRTCPSCGKDVAGGSPHYPFCSKRCQQIDLGRWADESYRISRPIEQRDLEED